MKDVMRLLRLEFSRDILLCLDRVHRAGDFFTGPIYYYLMAPFLWLFHLDPVGPAVMVALFGVATVWLIYHVGKEFFDKKTGLIAAALYSVSPLVITYSHSSWNPNVVPFFSLLTLYFLYKAVTIVTFVEILFACRFFPWNLYSTSLYFCFSCRHCCGFIVHYAVVSQYQDSIVPLIKYYLEIFVGFLIGYSPFLAFEVRHGFPNTKTIIKFITTDTTRQHMRHITHFISRSPMFFSGYLAGLFLFIHHLINISFIRLIQLQLYGLVIVLIAVASIALLFLIKINLL